MPDPIRKDDLHLPKPEDTTRLPPDHSPKELPPTITDEEFTTMVHNHDTLVERITATERLLSAYQQAEYRAAELPSRLSSLAEWRRINQEAEATHDLVGQNRLSMERKLADLARERDAFPSRLLDAGVPGGVWIANGHDEYIRIDGKDDNAILWRVSREALERAPEGSNPRTIMKANQRIQERQARADQRRRLGILRYGLTRAAPALLALAVLALPALFSLGCFALVGYTFVTVDPDSGQGHVLMLPVVVITLLGIVSAAIAVKTYED